MPRAQKPAKKPEHDAGDNPAEIALARFALNLRQALADRALPDVAARSGIDVQLLGQIAAGKVYPGIDVMEALEHALDTDLWPRRKQNSNTDDSSE
jgi:transcriptional regulator with XRE-family HTH domain